jgi:preflagellin peptidase FlaK
MCIALALPVYPNNLLSQPTGFTSPLFAISIFSNSVILGALSVFYALFRNIIWILRNKQNIFKGLEKESLGRKIVALISGYKIKLSKLEKDQTLPLEDVNVNDAGELERTLLVFPKYEESEDIISRIKESKLDKWVWVTPGLPLLLFITAGLVIGLIYGEIVWFILESIIS